jgi:beta-galactosidase GanA
MDDKPWMPVMSELHYTRIPEDVWETETLKMKSAGANIIATYVFCIHHEEIEGHFDWSGRRNLRHGIELCARHGMCFYLRPGPWTHGGDPAI